MHGAVVHSDILVLKETDDLSTSKYHRPIAVGGVDIHRAIVIEGGIEGHACADTDTSHLAA